MPKKIRRYSESLAGNITMLNGVVVGSGLSSNDVYSLSAYDIDDTTYRTFLSLTSGNTPSLAISAPTGGVLSFDGGTVGLTTPVEYLASTNFIDDGYAVGFGSGLFAAGKVNMFMDLNINSKFTVSNTSGNTYIEGSLGIGTTSPFGLFHVKQGGGVKHITVENTYLAGPAPSEIYFSRLTAGETHHSAVGYADDRGAFFWVAGLDRMNISPAGNVGIGVTTATNKLDVNGGVGIGSPFLTAPTNGLVVRGDIQIGDTTADAAANLLMYKTELSYNSTRKTTTLSSTADGSGTDGYAGIDIQSKLNDVSIGIYDGGTSKYIAGQQFYADKSVLTLPTNNIHDSALVYGTAAYGKNGLSNTSYASCYPFIDESNNSLKFSYKDTSGNQRYVSIKSHTDKTYHSQPAVTKTASFTVGVDDYAFVCNAGSEITVTLPSASASPGRHLRFKNISVHAVVSASSNVVPIYTATPGASLLLGGPGKFCLLISDGTNWVSYASN